jgi:hypothetical protein
MREDNNKRGTVQCFFTDKVFTDKGCFIAFKGLSITPGLFTTEMHAAA